MEIYTNNFIVIFLIYFSFLSKSLDVLVNFKIVIKMKFWMCSVVANSINWYSVQLSNIGVLQFDQNDGVFHFGQFFHLLI
jgi:hypothetical protein